MRRHYPFLAIAWAALSVGSLADLVAQDPPPPAAAQTVPEPAKTAGPTAVEASPLDTFLLRDSKGNLVPVLDLSFEEFERLLRIQRGLAPVAPPGYSLDSLTVSGSVEKDLAELQVTATIRVRDPGWVRVPLTMGKAILRQPAKYEGPGRHFVTYDAADGSYVCWLEGADAKPHVITLNVSAVVAPLAGESRMALALPRATESSLRLSVPDARAVARLTGGDGIVSSRSVESGRSEVNVLGPSGSLELAWQKGREPLAPGPTLLESTGEIAVKIEGENRISCDARLRVRSFGGSIEAFRVRLPPGMEFVPTTAAGYAVTVVSAVEPSAAVRGQPAAQVVEVRYDRPASGVVEARLLAAPAAAGNAAVLMPARFEVIGAVRQRGTVDFSLEGDWQLGWKEDASVRRLDIPPDAASAKLAARYEYSRQPCLLQLTVATRPSRITVEPIHVVYIEDKQVRLESTLKYRLRGARAEGLTFDLGDWKLDSFTPGDLLDIAAAQSGAGPRMVPFLQSVAIPTELELKLQAHRTFDATTGEVSFALPRPVADVVAPATVMIVAADNVELTPQAGKLTGLSLDPTPAVARIASRQQPPLVYRDAGAEEPALFAADLRVRTGWTTASARAKVQIDAQLIQVEQRLDYRIAYERRRSFEILAPRAALAGGPFQVLLGEESLTPTPVVDAPAIGDATRFQVVAPSDQIGLCQLVVKYALPLPKWDRQKATTLTIPLIVPAADERHQQLGGQQLEFVTSETWRLEPDATGSDEFSRPNPNPAAGPNHYSWSRVTPFSRWTIEPAELGGAATVVVNKAWIQTWLAGGMRQDRAVFRLTTDQSELRVRLPKGLVAGSVQAAVNAQAVSVAVREPAIAMVGLPAAVRGRENVVELWYSMKEPLSAGAVTTAQLQAPVLDASSPPRRVFWQLCLPGNEHVLIPPADMAAEMQWRGDLSSSDLAGGPWGREASLSQAQLESWIGASRQDPLPRGANEYLFSSLGRAPTLTFTSASRRMLLLAASGAALMLGLILLHVSAARRPEALLAVSVVLAALSLALPDAAVLAAQAATIGLVVAAIAALWVWLGSGRTMQSAPPRSSVQQVPRSETRSTELPVPRPELPTGLTTATVSAAGAAAEPQ